MMWVWLGAARLSVLSCCCVTTASGGVAQFRMLQLGVLSIWGARSWQAPYSLKFEPTCTANAARLRKKLHQLGYVWGRLMDNTGLQHGFAAIVNGKKRKQLIK